jgi:hypothetical protein
MFEAVFAFRSTFEAVSKEFFFKNHDIASNRRNSPFEAVLLFFYIYLKKVTFLFFLMCMKKRKNCFDCFELLYSLVFCFESTSILLRIAFESSSIYVKPIPFNTTLRLTGSLFDVISGTFSINSLLKRICDTGLSPASSQYSLYLRYSSLDSMTFVLPSLHV